MTDWADQKAIEFASESAKQFMALAVVILTLASASKLVSDTRKWIRIAVAASAVSYCVAFGAGALFLLGLTAELDPVVDPEVQIGSIRHEPRQLQTRHGTMVFQREQSDVTIRPLASLSPTGSVVSIRTLRKPSIWTPFLQVMMTIEIIAFTSATFTFAFAFVWSLVRLDAGTSHPTAPVKTSPDMPEQRTAERKRPKHR